jgi:precorrin-6B methylase 2/predicted transcriptional regulator
MTLYTEKIQPEGESSSSVLLEMMYGYIIPQAVYVAAKLGIADILSNGAKTTDEIAKAAEVNSQIIYHLMRMLVSVGVFSGEDNGKFCLNSLGKHLLTGTSDSLRSTVMAMGGLLYPVWSNLLSTTKTGEPGFESIFKMSFYDYLKENSESAANFNEWMKETTREWLFPVIEAYDFSEVKTLVDVGGGTGSLTSVILKANPKMQAILFDREDGVVGAEGVLEAAGVTNRCQIVVGNFFESVPPSGDLYLLSRILLNWDDTQAMKILKNCHQVMKPEDRLMLIEVILPEGKMSPFLGIANLNLFLLGINFIRTEEEFCNLLSSGGFKVTNTIKTTGIITVLEAKPA